MDKDHLMGDKWIAPDLRYAHISKEDKAKIKVANQVLSDISNGRTKIERRKNGWYVHFYPNQVKRWQCRKGNSFYPVWQYHQGGTATTALSQLIRWLQGKPVLPISTWRHWASDTVKLCSENVADILLEGGYPEHVDCVLCGNRIKERFDWWNLDGVSGPCCHWQSGCKQKGKQQ